MSPLLCIDISLGAEDFETQSLRWHIRLGFPADLHAPDGGNKWRYWKRYEFRAPVPISA